MEQFVLKIQGNLIVRHSRHFSLACWALLGLIGNLRAAEVRTWTSDDGKSETRAELVKIDAHSVHLKKSNGKLVRVLLSKISEADRRFVEKQRKELLRTTKSLASSTTRIDPELGQAFRLKGYKVTRQGISLTDETKLRKGLRSSKQAQ